MKEKGLTQEALAELLDCSVGQVNMLITGKRKFHSDWIDRISTALNIPTWHLFVAPEDILPAPDQRIIKAYKSLDDEDRRIVDKFLKTESSNIPGAPPRRDPVGLHETGNPDYRPRGK